MRICLKCPIDWRKKIDVDGTTQLTKKLIILKTKQVIAKA